MFWQINSCRMQLLLKITPSTLNPYIEWGKLQQIQVDEVEK
ncbi:hypothetical protein COO91_09860 (plasmid) [Nostoc flagelliforme CCNUN1]|uniref:Uncharacterized protein n=1 Tax=Nostoc flagelliforme CCNUN1 TaxID=2038116 RepID=A0A2K8T7K1_9NOSO|nr:hypothetical protein COO91_09860 [Nostoc flagelliforme CCNUN1]